MVRRVGLAVVVIIAIVLIAVLVNGCETSARNSALKDYNNSVASLNEQSVQTGANFFSVLAGGTGDPTSLNTRLNEAAADGATQLSKAKGLSVPDEVKGAQQDFVQALQLRHDGMANIAGNVQAALQSQTSKDAVDTIAAEMARFYASDVLYKDYSVPMIVGALRAAGITVGGLGGQQLNSSQFLPSIQWLDPTHVASALHVSLPSSSSGQPKNIAPGLHGHQLNSVSVGGTALSTTSSNQIPGEPGPHVHAELREHRTEHGDERQVPGHDRRLERERADDRPADDRRRVDELPGDARLDAAQGVADRQGGDRAGAGREERVEQHVDVPGHVPVRSGVIVCCRQCTT